MSIVYYEINTERRNFIVAVGSIGALEKFMQTYLGKAHDYHLISEEQAKRAAYFKDFMQSFKEQKIRVDERTNILL